MKRGIAAVAVLLLLTAMLYFVVESVAYERQRYSQDAPFTGMADDLIAYLKGQKTTLDEPFTRRERDHMVDVQVLFRAANRLAWACLAVGLPASIFVIKTAGFRVLGQGYLIGLSGLTALFLGIGLWAAIDFDGWWRTMHALVFANDLWLLDPKESLLIRLVPLDFFITLCRDIAARFGVLCLAFLGLSFILKTRTT